MPWVAGLLTKANRNTHNNRRGKLGKRAPADRTAIVDLLGGRIGILAELNFRYGTQTAHRHRNRATNDPLFIQRCVEHPRLAKLMLQIDRRTVYAALRTNI